MGCWRENGGGCMACPPRWEGGVASGLRRSKAASLLALVEGGAVPGEPLGATSGGRRLESGSKDVTTLCFGAWAAWAVRTSWIDGGACQGPGRSATPGPSSRRLVRWAMPGSRPGPGAGSRARRTAGCRGAGGAITQARGPSGRADRGRRDRERHGGARPRAKHPGRLIAWPPPGIVQRCPRGVTSSARGRGPRERSGGLEGVHVGAADRARGCRSGCEGVVPVCRARRALADRAMRPPPSKLGGVDRALRIAAQ